MIDASFLVPPSPAQRKQIEVAVEMDRLKLQCKAIGCGDDTLAIYSAVAHQIAVSQPWLPNSTVMAAAFSLLYEILSEGSMPIPADQDSQEDWAARLWITIFGTREQGVYAASHQPENFVGWIQTVQNAWLTI